MGVHVGTCVHVYGHPCTYTHTATHVCAALWLWLLGSGPWATCLSACYPPNDLVPEDPQGYIGFPGVEETLPSELGG